MKLKKRIKFWALMMATLLLSAFTVGCAPKTWTQEEASAKLMSLKERGFSSSVYINDFIADSAAKAKWNMDAKGHFTYEMGENTWLFDGKQLYQNGNFVQKESSVIYLLQHSFVNEEFLTYIVQLLTDKQCGLVQKETKTDKEHAFYATEIQLKDFVDKALNFALLNIEGDALMLANFLLGKLFDDFTMNEFVLLLSRAVSQEMTFAQAEESINKALKPFSVTFKGIVNTFIPLEMFYDNDGFALDGVTLYDTAYETLFYSFKNMRFFTVLGYLLNGGVSFDSASFNTFLQSAVTLLKSIKIETLFAAMMAPHQFELLKQQAGSASFHVNNFLLNAQFALDKKGKVSYLQLRYHLDIKLKILGLNVPVLQAHKQIKAEILHTDIAAIKSEVGEAA